jgi:hypothetical protein
MSNSGNPQKACESLELSGLILPTATGHLTFSASSKCYLRKILRAPCYEAGQCRYFVTGQDGWIQSCHRHDVGRAKCAFSCCLQRTSLLTAVGEGRRESDFVLL